MSAYSFCQPQWVGSTEYTLCRCHSAWCGALCTACPRVIYPLPRDKASRGPETWRLVGKKRAHGVDVGEDAAISERSPRSQLAASRSSPLNPFADRLKFRTSVLQTVIVSSRSRHPKAPQPRRPTMNRARFRTQHHHCLTPDRRVKVRTQMVTTFLLTFLCKSGVAPCTIARVPGAFGARGQWIAARIVATSPQQTCHDHLPSGFPRRATPRPPGPKDGRCSGNAPRWPGPTLCAG